MRGRNCLRLLIFALAPSATLLPQVQAEPQSILSQAGNISEATPEIAGLRRVPPPVSPVPLRRAAFQQMVRAAGTIFSGTVIKIEPSGTGSAQSLETVAITFHVDDAIRGAVAGGNLTILEWAGLWSSGQRYRIGEHVALFLYPVSKLGLTSSVSGAMGRFEVDAARRILFSAQHSLAFLDDPILGGKTHVTFRELNQAVRNADGNPLRTTGGSHEN
jgi:hypothetical protein